MINVTQTGRSSSFFGTISVLLFLFCSCSKNDLQLSKEKELPGVETISITLVNPLKAVLSAKLIRGNYEIASYGIVYGTQPGVTLASGIAIATSEDFAGGIFTSTINFTTATMITDGKSLYAKAFYIDKEGTKYGKELSYTMTTTTAGTVDPMFGKSGDIVSITGKFSPTDVGDIFVNIGKTPAKIVSVSSTELKVEIPSNIPAAGGDKISVIVSVKGVHSVPTTEFVIKTHIKDFNPKTGPLSTEIIFTGDNLADDYIFPIYSVRIGDKNAMSFGNSPRRWLVGMDVGMVTAPVLVAFSDFSTEKIGEFLITPPVITGIINEKFPGTSWMRIVGTDVPTVSSLDRKYPKGKLGNRDIDLNTGYNGVIFQIPQDMEPGSWDFVLYAGPFAVKAPEKIIVPPHEIARFIPTTIKSGNSITVYGSFRSFYTYRFYLDGDITAEARCTVDGVVTFAPYWAFKPGTYTLSFKLGPLGEETPGKFYEAPTKLTIVQ